MGTPKRSWFKMFPTDWEGDHRLRECSALAEGVFLRMVFIMERAEPRGYLVSPRGPITEPDTLARLTGKRADEIRAGWDELLEMGVLSVVTASDLEADHEGNLEGILEGTLFSRRIVRDAKLSEHGKAAIQKRSDFAKNAKKHDEPSRVPSRYPSREPSPHNPDIYIPPIVPQDAKPKAAPKGRATRATLPAEWQPRPDEQALALGELKMTAGEYADALASFRDWAGSKGRAVKGEPNWNLAFRNHLREFARRIGSSYRRDGSSSRGSQPPSPSQLAGAATAHEATLAAKASSSAAAINSPAWWRDAARVIAKHYPGDWLGYWSRCKPRELFELEAPNLAALQMLRTLQTPELDELLGCELSVIEPQTKGNVR